jgi:peroxiredoxin
VAISIDTLDSLRHFRHSLGATFPFLSDPDGRVSRLYAGVSPLGTVNRVTVDVDRDGIITHVTEGFRAVLPDQDIKACPAHENKAPDDDST